MVQRVIFDTSIFPCLARDKRLSQSELEELQLKISSDSAFKVYWINVIRRELKNTFRYNKEFLNVLMKIYNFIIDREYFTDDKIEKIAKNYYEYYKKFGGLKDYEDIKTDILIVALASAKNIDILVSRDRETMSMDNRYGEEFRKAYHHINVINGLRDPVFWQYKDIKLKYGFFKKET